MGPDVPVIVVTDASVAVMVCGPFVFSVALNVCTPASPPTNE
jgi:hypothetical protein